MADLKDFPIGTSFYYLGVLMVVIAHASHDEEIICHYLNNHREVCHQRFHTKSFDYLQAIINDQRQHEETPSAVRGSTRPA